MLKLTTPNLAAAYYCELDKGPGATNPPRLASVFLRFDLPLGTSVVEVGCVRDVGVELWGRYEGRCMLSATIYS